MIYCEEMIWFENIGLHYFIYNGKKKVYLMIALIPARSGSKGLINKNLLKMNGKSLVQRAVETGLSSDYIEKIFISTDDSKIADEAVRFGAICPFLRPIELASDDSPAIDTYLFTIKKLQTDFGLKIEEICILQPTSPLRLKDDVDGAIRLFRDKKADSVVSLVKVEHPLDWCKSISSDLRIFSNFSNANKNRQEYGQLYRPNGAVFVFKADILMKKQYYTENSFAYIMPRERSIDIDEQFDFTLAENLLIASEKFYEKK